MPGGMFVGRNATCSVSAKKLSGLRFKTMRPTTCDRHQLLRDQLGRVEHVEGQRVRLLLGEQLHAELPLGEVAGRDGLEQVAAVVVGIGAGDLHRLVPAWSTAVPSFGPPVELHEGRLRPASLTSRKVWTPKPSIMRNERGMVRSDIAHMIMCVDSGISPMKSQNVSCARRRLRVAAVGLHLHRVDQVGELDRVLDEEDRDVVADEVPVALAWCRTSPRSRARRAACRPSRRRPPRSRSARTPRSSRRPR